MRFLFILLISSTLSVSAAPAKPPKVGLVLSGGAARGISHIGVLLALEELRIPVHAISGTSMGALIGGFYASGFSGQDLLAIAHYANWNEGFRQDTPRELWPIQQKLIQYDGFLDLNVGFDGLELKVPSGLIQGHGGNLFLKSFLTPFLSRHQFRSLAIPFACVATDIVSGDEVILKSGNLVKSIRASMSIPAVITPEKINGRLLVDGGLTNNLPIDVVRQLGADVVIAVDISEALKGHSELNDPLEITNQVSTILLQSNIKKQRATLGKQDVYIRPVAIEGIGSTDFKAAVKSIPAVEAATLKLRESLKPFQLSKKEYAAWRKSKQRPDYKPPVIDYVEVVTDSFYPDEFFLQKIQVLPGAPINFDRLFKGLELINATNQFEKVDFEILQDHHKTGLRIIAQQKSWGPGFLAFKFGLRDDFRGRNDYALGLRYIRKNINSLGAVASIDLSIGRHAGLRSEWHQPLSIHAPFFSKVYFKNHRELIEDYNESQLISIYNVKFQRYGMDFGLSLGSSGELSLGLGQLLTKTGLFEDMRDENRFNRGQIRSQYVRAKAFVDTLDRAHFPTDGIKAKAVWDHHYKMATTLPAHNVFSTEGSISHSFSGTTFTADWYGKGFSKNLDRIERTATLGGFRRLSGYHHNELKGQHAAVISIGGFQSILPDLDQTLFLGGALDAGKVWRESFSESTAKTIYGASVFIGAATPLGPAYLAYGYSSKEHQAMYFGLGHSGDWRY